MISHEGLFVPTFAPSNINDMSDVKYQNAAMEYAMWYQEHLLRMEDVMGKRLETKIEELIEKKIHEYMEKDKNSKTHLKFY
ncbi:MAG: hypothetical protein IKX33_05865 [Prevotella sp.]|nr:hypothetical protein [Prevotella sp.]